MKVAFTTQDMKSVDAYFGWAKNIAIYEISPEGYEFLEVVQFDGEIKEDGSEDKLTPKIDAVHYCAIVYVAAIGGSAAAKAVNAKAPRGQGAGPGPDYRHLRPATAVLQGTPPPWLRKALMKGRERRMDFDDDVEAECHV